MALTILAKHNKYDQISIVLFISLIRLLFGLFDSHANLLVFIYFNFILISINFHSILDNWFGYLYNYLCFQPTLGPFKKEFYDEEEEYEEEECEEEEEEDDKEEKEEKKKKANWNYS